MKYIEALTEHVPTGGEKSVFLAGGITGCPDWQELMVDLLRQTDLTLLNPRRKNFPIGDPNAAREQIAWEYYQLEQADAILYWFPKDTICPIVLFELGRWSNPYLMRDVPIFVGIETGYPRTQDVEIQMELAQPDVEIVYSLEELALQVRLWGRGKV